MEGEIKIGEINMCRKGEIKTFRERWDNVFRKNWGRLKNWKEEEINICSIEGGDKRLRTSLTTILINFDDVGTVRFLNFFFIF